VKPKISAVPKVEKVEINQALIDLVNATLDDSKAENILEINLLGKTSIADVMFIASGRSDRHVGAIADHLVQTLKDKGHEAPRVEGVPQCDWVLIDAGDIIVHVFRPEVREFYNLEKMWGTDRPQELKADLEY
jgi:ribosome-associated protein